MARTQPTTVEIEVGAHSYCWNLEQGAFSVAGVPSTMLSLDPSLRQLLEPLVDDCGMELFRMLVAQSAASASDRDFAKITLSDQPKLAERFDSWIQLLKGLGWGHVTLLSLSEARQEATLQIDNAWELRMQSELPVSKRWGAPFMQGKLIGLFSRLFGKTCWAEPRLLQGADPMSLTFDIAPSDRTLEKEISRLQDARLTEKNEELRHRIAENTRELEAARQALREHAEHLESQVAARTEQLEAQNRELIRAKAEAEQVNQLKSLFLASMSHEIRTPMNGVLGMASLLAETEMTAEQKELTSTIQKSGELLLTIVNDILDFSKIESGQLEIEETHYSPLHAVEETMDLFVLACQQKRINLITSIEPGLPYRVLGDPTRFRQILVNLLSNAVKFTERGEITISLATEAAGDDQLRLIVSVADTGCGIDEAAQARLFTPFTQADSSTTRKHGGTGLGLSISQRLARAMDGDLQCRSAPGKGSEFCFSVCVRKTAEAEIAPPLYERYQLKGKRVGLILSTEIQRVITLRWLAYWGARGSVVVLEDCSELSALESEFDALLASTKGAGPQMRELKQLKIPLIELYSTAHSSVDAGRLALNLPLRIPLLWDALCRALDHDDGSEETPADASPSTAEPLVLAGLQILVAEDNLVNQKVTSRMLTKLGAALTIAPDGLAAVSEYQGGGYDLILMDMHMPNMDGIEATRNIRELEQRSNATPIPIIALTAGVLTEDRERCLAAGVDEILTKPVRLDHLKQMIEQTMRPIWAERRELPRAPSS